METAHWLILGAVFLLLALSAFFSGSETALTAASRLRLYHLAKSGDPRAHVVAELRARKERMIGAILIGNNLVKPGPASGAPASPPRRPRVRGW